MLMPSLFGENLLDEFFETPHFARRSYGSSQKLMNTDVKDLGDAYEIAMDLPGFKKEDVPKVRNDRRNILFGCVNNEPLNVSACSLGIIYLSLL